MLRVEYEVLPANLDPRKAMDKDTPLVHPEDNWKALCNIGADNKKNLCATEETHEGDVDAVLADCDVVVEHTYHTKANQQAMMETFRTYCFIDEYGRLNVVSSTQIVFHVRRILSNALCIPNQRFVYQNQELVEDLEQNRVLSPKYIQTFCHMDDKETIQDLFFQEKSLRSHLHQDMRCR